MNPSKSAPSRRTADFRQKEVINIADGARLGYISDVEIDFEKGVIESIVIPRGGKLFSFSSGEDLVIAWSQIRCIGEEVILVEL